MQQRRQLPPPAEMLAAVRARDASYEGVFVLGVRTTGIFCRPGCPAKTPNDENIEFFPSVGEALSAGFRACKRCRPLEARGTPPDWLRGLLDEVERDPARRWRDRDLRALGLEPVRVRRWFQAQHGMTFHAFSRARRLGHALGRLGSGASTTESALDAGFESQSGFHDAFVRTFGATPSQADLRPAPVVRLPSPLGPLVAAALDEGVCLLEFADRPMLPTQIARVQTRFACALTPGRHPHLATLAAELEEYFAGARRKFDVPLLLGGTPFQERVWSELLAIPYGATRTYEELAAAAGRPGAQRAAGTANGQNRLAIVVPCHRVVRKGGALGGYGGGLWRKRTLLDLERPPERPPEERADGARGGTKASQRRHATQPR